jgi:nicotinamidase-related amidase
LSEEDRKKYWGVIPEMEFNPDTDELLCNWISSPWNYSGLDLMLQKYHADTVVWGGFALQSAVYSGSNGCSDHLFNTIMCVDASYACVAKMTPGYHEGLNDVVAEAIIRVMAPAICRCTDTATVLEKLKTVPNGKAK